VESTARAYPFLYGCNCQVRFGNASLLTQVASYHPPPDFIHSEGIVKKNVVEEGSVKTADTFESAPEPFELPRFSPKATTTSSPGAYFQHHSPTKFSTSTLTPDAESTTRQNSLLESTQQISFKASPKRLSPSISPSPSILTPSKESDNKTKESKERPAGRRLSGRISESIINAALMLTAAARNSFSRNSRKVGVDTTDPTSEQDLPKNSPDKELHYHSTTQSISHPISHTITHTMSNQQQLEVEHDPLGLCPEQDNSDLFITNNAPMTRGCSTISSISNTSTARRNTDFAYSPSRTLTLSIYGDSTTAPSRRRYASANTMPNISTEEAKRFLAELASQSRGSNTSSPCNSDKSTHNHTNGSVVEEMD